MAYGVENALAVCCFMTPEYQESKNCQKELLYADEQNVPIIPCRIRSDWKPSSWLVPELPTKQFAHLAISNKSKSGVLRKTFLIGNTHKELTRKTAHGNTSEWTFFVRPPSSDRDSIETYIKRIRVYLHKTFSPPLVILDRSPFEITRTGWGEFEIRVIIEFQDEWHHEDLEIFWNLTLRDNESYEEVDVEFDSYL
ncbi:unnamed protein product, partial [Didymodactylos carnosus]